MFPPKEVRRPRRNEGTSAVRHPQVKECPNLYPTFGFVFPPRCIRTSVTSRNRNEAWPCERLLPGQDRNTQPVSFRAQCSTRTVPGKGLIRVPRCFWLALSSKSPRAAVELTGNNVPDMPRFSFCYGRAQFFDLKRLGTLKNNEWNHVQLGSISPRKKYHSKERWLPN